MSLVEFTVTRNTQKNVINSEGFLENVGNNVPGFEYKRELIVVFDDPESDSDEIEEVFTYRGALIEPASTNLCLQSENINTTWTANPNATPTQSTETTPDGDTSNKYIKLVDDDGGGSGAVFVQQSINVSANTKYTASVFAKADGLSFLGLFAVLYDGATIGGQGFELSGAGSLDTASNLDDSKIEAYPNGWYRCSITWTQGASDTNFIFRVRVNNSISNSTAVPLDGTSSIFVWGAQVEQGSEPSSYIKTVGSIATRNADIIRLLNADQYTPNEGQVVLEWEQYESDTLHIGLVSGSVEPGVRKLKFIYTSTEQKLYIDDVLVDSITGNYDWSGMDKIELGNFNGTDQPTTHLRLFAINENTV
jgi:hypothetical protein